MATTADTAAVRLSLLLLLLLLWSLLAAVAFGRELLDPSQNCWDAIPEADRRGPSVRQKLHRFYILHIGRPCFSNHVVSTLERQSVLVFVALSLTYKQRWRLLGIATRKVNPHCAQKRLWKRFSTVFSSEATTHPNEPHRLQTFGLRRPPAMAKSLDGKLSEPKSSTDVTCRQNGDSGKAARSSTMSRRQFSQQTCHRHEASTNAEVLNT